MRATHSSHKPHKEKQTPTITSHLYRNIKFLPTTKVETPLQRYTGVAKLENYIEDTKQNLADNLSSLFNYSAPNLPTAQRTAFNKLRQLRHTLTIKPADKNLGIVLMNTNDYITQCLAHLTDRNTYRLTTDYPKDTIRKNSWPPSPPSKNTWNQSTNSFIHTSETDLNNPEPPFLWHP